MTHNLHRRGGIIEQLNTLTGQIIGASVAVHRELGPGLLESAYEACLTFKLVARGLTVERQKALPVMYRGHRLDCGYRLDIVVENAVVVEVKSIERLDPVHMAQMLSYLRLSGCKVGFVDQLQREMADKARDQTVGTSLSRIGFGVLRALCG